MNVNSINSYQGVSSTNFKAAVPVFMHVIPEGKSIAEALPITDAEHSRGYMQKLLLNLNDSLTKGKHPKRDLHIKNFREFFGNYIKDFRNSFGVVDKTSKVRAYTCVDGGRREDTLYPLFYLTTGATKSKLLNLENEFKQAKKLSGGYRTAEMDYINKKYHLTGKNIVNTGFNDLKNSCGEPLALHVYFSDTYTKTGTCKGHKVISYAFKPTSAQNPSIRLSK